MCDATNGNGDRYWPVFFQRFNDDRAEVAAAIDYSIDVMLSFEWYVDGKVYVNVDEIKVDSWENNNDDDE